LTGVGARKPLDLRRSGKVIGQKRALYFYARLARETDFFAGALRKRLPGHFERTGGINPSKSP
jgi:hypothetical protein